MNDITLFLAFLFLKNRCCMSYCMYVDNIRFISCKASTVLLAVTSYKKNLLLFGNRKGERAKQSMFYLPRKEPIPAV